MRRLLLAAALGTTWACHASAQTSKANCSGQLLGPAPFKLRTVLDAYCIPVPTTSPSDASVQYGAYNSPTEFLMAYQLVKSPDKFEPQPLWIMRFEKQTKTWTTAEFSDFRTEILPGFTASCLGSAGGVEKVGAFFYVSIDLSPSAECQLVVSDKLQLKTVLSGWPVARFSWGAVVLQGSMVHFFPTHPLRLSLYDPRSATLTPIYPPVPDPLRASYMQRLVREMPPSERCTGENCATDPEQFESYLHSSCTPAGQCQPAIATNENTGTLAFVVEFSPIGFISRDLLESSTKRSEKVIYIYRLFPGPPAHREFTLSDAEARLGTTSPEMLLTPELLARIFPK